MANRWCNMCGGFHDPGTACTNVAPSTGLAGTPPCCEHWVEITATLQRIESMMRHAMGCIGVAVPSEFDVK